MLTVLGFAALFMWLNATNFDMTELKTIAELAAVIMGVHVMRQKQKGQQ